MCNAQPIDALTPPELSIEIGIRKGHPEKGICVAAAALRLAVTESGRAERCELFFYLRIT
jgi:hypothetical protein